MMTNNSSLFSIKNISLSHIFLLALSNILVQYPFALFGFHTTWGAFTYPAIFILTDLTVRISSSQDARKIIFLSMIPGLLISYAVASYIEGSKDAFFTLHIMPLRIAMASFIAYVAGQFLDIYVFQRYRNGPSWWQAPALSTTIGNWMDTLLFFAIAFYHCPNPFLSEHWMGIALVDVLFKMAISLFAFVPIYGFIFAEALPGLKARENFRIS